MFPNSQTALPLPRQPHRKLYEVIAEDLIKAAQSHEPGAIRIAVTEWVDNTVKASGFIGEPELPAHPAEWIDSISNFAQQHLRAHPGSLAAAQFVIARSQGFQDWPKFMAMLEQLARASSAASRFEAAADAIVRGDIATLSQLLQDEPELIHARSAREHAATLLHYVSANGVEGYRQRTPPNIVEIVKILLRAGADVDATANVYDGGCTTLGLAATSVHPARAGVQDALLKTLLDSDAQADGLVSACLANGRLQAAELLAGWDSLLGFAEEAALGRLEAVQLSVRAATQEQREQGFLNACEYGRDRVAAFLIQQGVHVAAADHAGQTGLHRAVIGGHLGTIQLLLKQKAPLEAVNQYGGTVYGQALWSAANGGDPEVYAAILKTLADAGAIVPAAS